MDQLKESILDCLKDLKGSGKFLTVQQAEFQFPGLEVDGAGEIAYPINEIQAKALIAAAHKAPFGKGTETILDNKVRSAWEIDADKLHFSGNKWTKFIEKVLTKIKPDLGLEDYAISASLYKMLIYEKGDFFLEHKDSEKEKGMFGTMIVGLPSKHTGGELVVRFGGVEETADFSQNSGDYKIDVAAFYADCDHEVKPLLSGYRVCLVYNLIQEKSGNKIQLHSLDNYVSQLEKILIKQSAAHYAKPLIILLGHQYTPENFSESHLKLDDRPKAEVLMRAAKKAGYFAKMCLVTSYKMGMPDDDGYGRYGEGGDDDAEMVEVFDESIYIEHWAKNDLPALGEIEIEEKDLITSFELDEDEPILKECSGYMGNYGPDLEHWYHYGAVMIWSPATNTRMLASQNMAIKMDWVAYLNKKLKKITDDEIATIENIISAIPADADKKANYNAVADWVMNRKDTTFFLKLELPKLQFLFKRMDTAQWLKLFQFLPESTVEKIFEKVTQEMSLGVMGQILALLATDAVSEKPNKILIKQIKKLPEYFSALVSKTSKKNVSIKNTSLQQLLQIEKTMAGNETWINSIADTILQNQERIYLHAVLVPELLAIKPRTMLIDQILYGCRQYILALINNKPEIPADWTRKVPDSNDYKKQWQILKAFLESPTESVFEFRRNQAERSEMQRAINSVEIDLRTETIQKGSPHALMIIKTMADYNKQMKNWNEDVALLKRMENIQI